LVRGCHEDGFRIGECQLVDPQPAVIYGHWDELQFRSGELSTRVSATGIFDREPANTASPQGPRYQRERLGQAGRNDHPIGVRASASDPAEVVGQRFAQLGGSAGVAVAQALVWSAVQRAPHRCEPLDAREKRKVRSARPEVKPWLRSEPAARMAVGCVVSRERRHTRAGAPLGDQVSLGDQLLVSLDDHASRNAQLGGESPGRGKRSSRAQRSREDRLSQLLLELGVQWRRAVDIETK
jgi:hypothetical protein